MAIIDLQRRMVEVGRIRTGGRKPERGAGRKLEHWRLSSADRTRLDEAAKLWGGTVTPWEDAPSGPQFDLLTETAELPILLLPGQALSQWWELWSGGGCQRRCDGVQNVLADAPCVCDTEDGERKCKPTTRLSVMLPDIPGLGCWRLESHGYYAAVELGATAAMLEQATAAGQIFPARLRLEQRRKVEGGQTLRYAVPVIDIDVLLNQALAGLQQPALTAADGGYRALPAGNGVTVNDGLEAAARQATPAARSGRSAEPIGSAADFFSTDPVPVPDDQPDAAPAAAPASEPKPATKAQHGKANVLVGQLRDRGLITTEQLWAACAKLRSIDVDTMIEVLDGRDDAGVLHWSPLRDSLTRGEASNLIDRLERLETGAAA